MVTMFQKSETKIKVNIYRVVQKKNAKSLEHRNSATAKPRVMRFSSKSTEFT